MGSRKWWGLVASVVLVSACYGAITNAQLNKMTQAQFDKMTVAQLKAISYWQVKKMSSSERFEFSVHCYSAFNTKQAQIDKITDMRVSAITNAQFDKMTVAQQAQFYKTTNRIIQAQYKKIADMRVSAITNAQLNKMISYELYVSSDLGLPIEVREREIVDRRRIHCGDVATVFSEIAENRREGMNPRQTYAYVRRVGGEPKSKYTIAKWINQVYASDAAYGWANAIFMSCMGHSIPHNPYTAGKWAPLPTH